MTEDRQVVVTKNPVGAGILSAIFPGMGMFYIGNVVKGFAYMGAFALIIVLLVHARSTDNVVFALMLAGFYIYQVFDSYNEAKRTDFTQEKEMKPIPEQISLTGSWIILIVGVVFQLVNITRLDFHHIVDLWPLFLIGVGLKYIYDYSKEKKIEEGEKK